MARKNYQVDEVIWQLAKKNDCRVFPNKVIEVLTNSSPDKIGDLGNKSWGKIDFLTKYNGYTLVKVTHLTPYKAHKSHYGY